MSATFLAMQRLPKNYKGKIPKEKNYFRQRFRHYVQKFSLYLSPQHKLELESRLEEGKIRVHIPNTFLLNKPKT